jgi:hypothetical protein
VENVILKKDFNLGMTGSFFHAFTLGALINYEQLYQCHHLGFILNLSYYIYRGNYYKKLGKIKVKGARGTKVK